MKWFQRIFVLLVLISPLYAAEKPLIVGIERFNPPFIIQGSHDKIYGFDIDIMNALCHLIKRSCQYKIMNFRDLIPAVANNDLDLAISAITITPERSHLVNFSLPYLMSFSRLLTLNNEENKQAFTLKSLDGKRLGMVKGTVFTEEINHMGIANPVLVEYSNIQEALEGLQRNDVNYLLLDNYTALYWEANSSGAFMAAGMPYLYGMGLGIAINPREKELESEINKALLLYQETKEYQHIYHQYISF